MLIILTVMSIVVIYYKGPYSLPDTMLVTLLLLLKSLKSIVDTVLILQIRKPDSADLFNGSPWASTKKMKELVS